MATSCCPVRIYDSTDWNHMCNDAVGARVHEARMQWLQEYDYTELAIECIGLIMSDLAVEFSNESFYGDMIEIKIGIGETTRVGFELCYQLQTTRNNETVLLAHAKTGMVCYDYSAKKVAAIPDKLNAILKT